MLYMNKRPLKLEKEVKIPESLNLKILNYNVWSHDLFNMERLQEVINIIESNIPDIIGLQEVTLNGYKLLQQQLSNRYYLFTAFIDEENTDGSCILFHKNIFNIDQNDDNPYYYDFDESNTGYRVLGCSITHIEFNITFDILVTQLDKIPGNQNNRLRQFKLLKTIIKNIEGSNERGHFVFLLGDFSIYNNKEPIESELRDIVLDDLWTSMSCPSFVKYTMDSDKNKLIKNTKIRSDRIMFTKHSITNKTDIEHYKISSTLIKLLGLKNVSSKIEMPPSPHFGLLGNFVIK